MGFVIQEADPQGEAALILLREAAREARALYPELHPPGAPWPTNPPTPERGIYLIGYLDGEPVASGALRPMGETIAEIRRMYVLRRARRAGLSRKMLQALEAAAYGFGYKSMRLETGYRQLPAMALYESYGFQRIEPFGEYAGDPTSVCYEKAVQAPP